MIYHYLVAENLREAFYIFTAPGLDHLAIAAELIRHQIMCRLETYHLETIRVQLYIHLSTYIVLRIAQKCLDVTHDRVVELAFMQPVAVERRQLVFP